LFSDRSGKRRARDHRSFITSQNRLTGTVTIPASGKWDLFVTTPDSGTAVKKGVFTVKPWPAPRVASMTPTTVTHGTTVSYTLAGSNLPPESTVTLINSSAPGLNFTASVNKLTQIGITGTFDVPAIAAGKYGIEVTCPDGKVATKKNALTIK